MICSREKHRKRFRFGKNSIYSGRRRHCLVLCPGADHDRRQALSSVTEEEEGDCDALILKEIPQEEDTDSIYEIVEEDTELAAVASVFESMLEDIEIEP